MVPIISVINLLICVDPILIYHENLIAILLYTNSLSYTIINLFFLLHLTDVIFQVSPSNDIKEYTISYLRFTFYIQQII